MGGSRRDGRRASKISAHYSSRGALPRCWLRALGERIDLLLVALQGRLNLLAIGDDVVEGVAQDLLDLKPVGHIRASLRVLECVQNRFEVGPLPLLDCPKGVSA